MFNISTLSAQKQDSLLIRLKKSSEINKPEILNQLWKATRNIDLEKANTYAVQALKIAKELNQKEQIGVSLKNIGIGYWLNNELDSALTVYNESLEIFHILDNKKEIANLYNNISVILTHKGLRDSSIVLLQKSLDINLLRNDSVGIYRNYVNIAVLYYETLLSDKKSINN